MSSPSLGNAVLRQAILAAIDRDAIVKAVYPDLADPLSTVVPVGVAGHDPDRCEGCPYDPEAAAAKVRVAFPDGNVPVVNIDFDESTAQEAMAKIVATDLEEAGIPTELRPLSIEEYKRFVVSGNQELFSFGWIGAYGSPDAYLAPLFGSAANDNLTDYRSIQVDGLLTRARSGTVAAKNAERWVAAESQILEAAVVVPIAQFRTQVVVAERVQGFVHAVDGTVDWARVQVRDCDPLRIRSGGVWLVRVGAVALSRTGPRGAPAAARVRSDGSGEFGERGCDALMGAPASTPSS